MVNFLILGIFFFCVFRLVRVFGRFCCFVDIDILLGNVIEFLWGVEIFCFVFLVGGGVERRIVGFLEEGDIWKLLFLLLLCLWVLCLVLCFLWLGFLLVECFKFFVFEVLGFLLDNWIFLVNGILFCFKCWIYFCLVCFLCRLIN